MSSATDYEQPVISTKDWVRSKVKKSPLVMGKDYALSLFPIVKWIHKYNIVWGYSDLIAGLTLGTILVPQSMGYAKIATLEPQYGLYSAFVGVFVYCFFATSKDICIGPVAVMSLQVAKAIAHVHKTIPTASGPEIATALSLICGIIAGGLGILRLGFVLEYISGPAVMGFVTGSAFTITAGQTPHLFGIQKRINSHEATYMIVIDTLKNLKHSTLDTAFGLVPLFILYVIKYSMQWVGNRYPKYKKAAFFFSTLRLALVVIFATLISWGVCKSHKHGNNPTFPLKILQTVPSGLRDVGPIHVDPKILSALGSEIPVSVIVLLLEHIAIAKSFGRVNDYKISPDQEVIAIGVTNLIGTVFHAYPATGGFSRTAMKAKAGVRTPLAGLFSGAVVLVAIYALTGAFYWIPNATLSAITIHAVCDLIAPWEVTYELWKTAPVECLIFIIDVFLNIFVTIEVGVYFSIAASAAWLLLRLAKAKGKFLGRVAYVEEHVSNVDEGSSEQSKEMIRCTQNLEEKSITYQWVPLDHTNLNPELKVIPPPPGILVYLAGESFIYPNGSRLVDDIYEGVEKYTRSGLEREDIPSLGERSWNDPFPRKIKKSPEADNRPILKQLYLDFSSSPLTDATAVQYLVDLQRQINQYACTNVEIHFTGILSPWVRRALIAHGFGGGEEQSAVRQTASHGINQDEETGVTSSVPVVGTNTPFFHFRLPDFD